MKGVALHMPLSVVFLRSVCACVCVSIWGHFLDQTLSSDSCIQQYGSVTNYYYYINARS